MKPARSWDLTLDDWHWVLGVDLYGVTGKKAVKLKTVKLGARGYFDVRLRVPGASRRQYFFKSGKAKSIVVAAH